MIPRPRWLQASPLLALTAWLFGCTPSPPVAIGTGLSMTFVDATRMALAEEGARGGLPLLDTLLLAESTSRAEPALALAAQIAATPGMIAMVGHSNSSSSLSAAPIYNQAGIVQIAPTATSVEFSNSGPFSFRLAPPDPLQGALLVGAIDSLFPDGTRIALLYVNDDYGQGLRRAVLARLDRARFPVVVDQPHADVDRSVAGTIAAHTIRTTLAGVEVARPGLVLWLGRAATLREYLPELRRTMGNVPILGGDALSSHSLADLATGLWDGVRYADYLDMQATPARRAFAHRFQARYGTAAQTGEVLSYDGMALILAAVREGARTGDEVRRWLHSLGRTRPPWDGLSGPIAFTDQGDVERPYVLISLPARDSAP